MVNWQKESKPLFDNPLWDVKKIAEMLSVPEPTVRDWVYKRKIPHYKVGHSVRFDPSEIRSWILERSQNGYREDSR